jgi:hypothetical protein
VAHSRELKSSLKNKIQDWGLRERGELKLWISRKLFMILSGQRPKGVSGGLFIVPTSKRVIGRLSTEQVR